MTKRNFNWVQGLGLVDHGVCYVCSGDHGWPAMDVGTGLCHRAC